jgi:anti-sigma B factor antagonist
VETAIGVFDSRERAEEALKELFEHNIPQDSIVFLTLSETEAVNLAKDVGAYAGGFLGGAAGLSAGVAAAMLLIPGLGPAFALGIGATALLGLAGARGGSAMGKAISKGEAPEAMPDNEDAELFRKVLKEGRSLIVVRTPWREVVGVASAILDRYGIAMQKEPITPSRTRAADREVSGVTIVDITGRITLGEGNMILREIIGDLVSKGRRKIVLNLAQVDFIDSAGMGELVKSYTTLRKQGGQLKLMSLHEKVENLLKLTSLTQVFDIHKDEVSAIRAFEARATA